MREFDGCGSQKIKCNRKKQQKPQPRIHHEGLGWRLMPICPSEACVGLGEGSQKKQKAKVRLQMGKHVPLMASSTMHEHRIQTARVQITQAERSQGSSRKERTNLSGKAKTSVQVLTPQTKQSSFWYSRNLQPVSS